MVSGCEVGVWIFVNENTAHKRRCIQTLTKGGVQHWKSSSTFKPNTLTKCKHKKLYNGLVLYFNMTLEVLVMVDNLTN